MNYQDDLYDYVMEHNPGILDPALWSENEREALHKRERQFISGLISDAADLPKADPAQRFADAEKLRKWVEAVESASR